MQSQGLNTESFSSVLKRHGLKATRQRVAVNEAMIRLGHASADMVSEELRNSGEHVTVASVYNILSQLADFGIYGRRMSSNNKMYFDVNTNRHFHLYDRENNRYRDIEDEDLMDLISAHLRKRRFKGYTVEDIDIQFVARPAKKAKTAI